MATILKNGNEQHELTKEDMRKGGKRSGEVRKEKATLRKALEMLLDEKNKNILFCIPFVPFTPSPPKLLLCFFYYIKKKIKKILIAFNVKHRYIFRQGIKFF